MLVTKGGVEIPALEHCSLAQACIWIEHGEAPVEIISEGALPGRAHDAWLGGRLNNYWKGWCELFALASAGGITFEGHPAIGIRNIDFKDFFTIDCETWGPKEAISISRINQAGNIGFCPFGYSLVFQTNKECWGYCGLTVDFRTLYKIFPPPDGKAIRIGGGRIMAEQAQNNCESNQQSDLFILRVPSQFRTDRIYVLRKFFDTFGDDPNASKWTAECLIAHLKQVAKDCKKTLSNNEARSLKNLIFSRLTRERGKEYAARRKPHTARRKQRPAP